MKRTSRLLMERTLRVQEGLGELSSRVQENLSGIHVVKAYASEEVETALRRCISSGHTRLVVTEDENRVRQNLQVLRDTPAELEMRKKYLGVIEKAETRLDLIRDEAKQAAAARQQLEVDLAKKVQDFRDE